MFTAQRRGHLEERAGSCYRERMRWPTLPIGPRQAALIACGVATIALIYLEGWIWPLKAAAAVIPIALLAG